MLRCGAGLALLAVVGAGVGYPLWWGHRSTESSAELLSRAGVAPAKDVTRHPSGESQPRHDMAVDGLEATCVRASPPLAHSASPDSTPAGVLEIPSIAVVAPVLQGTDDAALAIAVGHDPSSPWPGAVGTSILVAHDVSFFSHIDELSVGQSVIWQSGCSTSTFDVTTSAVMHPGEDIPLQPSGDGLALVTCWPTDALWWTSQRYVVEAKLVSTTLAPSPQAWPAPQGAELTVPAAPSLVATGLSLDDNPVSLGTLTLTGTPSASYSSGPEPLDAANAAISEYIAARKSVDGQNQSWWQSIAEPGVAMPQSWLEPAPLNMRINVDDEEALNMTLTSGPVTVVLDVSRGTLRVASVTD
jgi:sortase A